MNPIDAIFKVLAELVAFYYGLIPNYAIAIALLTVTVMLVLAPLTWKSTRSMIAMQTLQPEMKRIQQQYKSDRVKLNEEMMALYKEHNVNPLTSCLPQFLQLPVFFIMYRVVRGLAHIPKGQKTFVPQYISKSSALYKSLLGKTQMKSFGLDLADSASKALHKSFVHALPFLLLVAVVIVTQIIQTRQMMGRNPGAAQNQQAQMMNKLMPALFGIWSYLFPAGLNVYFLVSNVMRIGQQSLMYRLDPSLSASAAKAKEDGPPKKPIDAKSSPSGPETRGKASPSPSGSGKKGFLERLREAAAAPPAKDVPGKGPAAKGGGRGAPPKAAPGKDGTSTNGKALNGKATNGTGDEAKPPQGARSGSGPSRNKKKRRGR